MGEKGEIQCSECHGTGVDDLAVALEELGAVLPLRCGLCDGSGVVSVPRQRHFGEDVDDGLVCPYCGATEPCKHGPASGGFDG